jgi:hypothetical protein
MNFLDDEFEKALVSNAHLFPASIIADLLMHFEPNIVAKFLKIYSGQQLTFPTIESIWKHHRNMVVVATLKIRDSRIIRKRLAIHFGIPVRKVSEIFTTHKHSAKPAPLSERAITQISERIFKGEIDETLKNIQLLLQKK